MVFFLRYGDVDFVFCFLTDVSVFVLHAADGSFFFDFSRRPGFFPFNGGWVHLFVLEIDRTHMQN
jgi:hypothetical protein